jgi:hypothetical protein
MNLSFFIIVISLLIFGLLIWALTSTCPVNKEGWVDYEELPYGNVRSGAGNSNIRPLDFYNYPIYRRPLNWPVCHLVDYPVPHCRSDSL